MITRGPHDCRHRLLLETVRNSSPSSLAAAAAIVVGTESPTTLIAAHPGSRQCAADATLIRNDRAARVRDEVPPRVPTPT